MTEPKIDRDPTMHLPRGKRGPARYYYTGETLAQATGLSGRSLRRLGLTGQRSGEKSAEDLIALAKVIARAQGWTA